MKRIVTLALALVFGMSAIQSASAHSSGSGSHGSQHLSTPRCISGHCDKDHQKNKLPPQHMGGSATGPAGTPENPFKPTPVTQGGFVFVNGHWERARAGQTTVVDPTLVGPVVRDHRGGSSGGGFKNDPTQTAPGGVIVGGYRGSRPVSTTMQPTPTTTTGFSGTVRDHRGSGSTSNDVVGVGASPVDSVVSGLAGIGSAVGDGLLGLGNSLGIGYGSITPVGGYGGSRDHRTN